MSDLKVDVGRVLRQHSHHVREAFINRDVQRRTHGVIQQVHSGSFTEQQTRNLRLVPAHTQTRAMSDTHRRGIGKHCMR